MPPLFYRANNPNVIFVKKCHIPTACREWKISRGPTFSFKPKASCRNDNLTGQKFNYLTDTGIGMTENVDAQIYTLCFKYSSKGKIESQKERKKEEMKKKNE